MFWNVGLPNIEVWESVRKKGWVHGIGELSQPRRSLPDRGPIGRTQDLGPGESMDEDHRVAIRVRTRSRVDSFDIGGRIAGCLLPDQGTAVESDDKRQPDEGGS